MSRKGIRPAITLTAQKLPAMIAARVSGLPETDQAALVRLVAEIGEAGLTRIINALAPGGRPAMHDQIHQLMLQMAGEMRARNPRLGVVIGGDWRKGHNAAAAKVARSPEGKAIGIAVDSLRKRLVREWEQYGRRLLQEHRDTELVSTAARWKKIQKQMVELSPGFSKIVRELTRSPTF